MRSLTSLAGLILWPSLLIKVVWLIMLAAIMAFTAIGFAELNIVPLVCIALLLFFMPLQFIKFRVKRSWWLLPSFRQQSCFLLITIALLLGLTVATAFLSAQLSFLTTFVVATLTFSLTVLPYLYYGSFRPVIITVSLCALLLGNTVKSLLITNWSWHYSVVLLTVNLLVIVWFAYGWLKPSRTKSAMPIISHAPIAHSLLLTRLTRKPATLSGTLLLGQGDSWVARCWRAAGYCWWLPGFMLIGSLLSDKFGFSDNPMFRALAILWPIMMLSEKFREILIRARRAWLVLPGGRQQLFGQLEQLACKEIIVCGLASSLVIMLLASANAMVPLLVFWPVLAFCCLYLSWFVINWPLLYSAITMALLCFGAVGCVIYSWQQPLHIVSATAALIITTLLLRLRVKKQLLQQNLATLKLQTLRDIGANIK